MTETEKVHEWCAFYRQSPLKYEMNALMAVYKNDGQRILEKVLNELGLDKSVDLVKDACK